MLDVVMEVSKLTEKRFHIDDTNSIIENNGYTEVNIYAFNDKKDWHNLCKRLNQQHKDRADLIKILSLYRKKMSCNNCHYHNYDWYDDGDEFEVCDKGNNECLDDGFCKDWEEL